MRDLKKQITGEGVMATTGGKHDNNHGLFLVNPRIIHRSLESEMLVWTEECLVLPPEFKATLLRDAEVTIEYETLTDDDPDTCGKTRQLTLTGELARCAQHEMDHDKGILIVDHVDLEELLSINSQTFMADVENSDGLHTNRMQRAFARDIYDSTLLPSTGINVDLALGDRDDFLAKIDTVDGYGGSYYSRSMRQRPPWFVQSASAMEDASENNNSIPSTRASSTVESDRSDSATSCDEACLEERKRRIQERRAMMQQSRSSTNRGEVLELSRQRALMYDTEYKGLSPRACSRPGFCP